MDTLGMVLTISGFSFCFVPGVAGFVAIFLAAVGITLGIVGMTNTATKPGDLGMDVASWVYGIITTSVGLAYQGTYNETVRSFVLPVSWPVATAAAAVLFFLFVAIQLRARKKGRILGIIIAVVLYTIISAFCFTAVSRADQMGFSVADAGQVPGATTNPIGEMHEIRPF